MKLLVFICIAAASRLAQAENITVMTEYGAVRGTTTSFPNATGPIKSVRRFLGIPFASPPVGELRFRPPEAPKSWKPNTYNAGHWRNVCIQPPGYTPFIKVFWPTFTNANYSEDCLYLNVFSPVLSSSGSTLLPVMVYVHSGSYVWGTPVYRPGDRLALRGVVVVTFQYRLGPFGFISTGDSVAPGNIGMLDQVEALKWVRANVKAFGGDPDQVTIFGMSAGGSSVGLQLLSPLSKGLFHRAISESGDDLAPWATHTTASAVRHTKSLATKLGCSVDDGSEAIVDCLRSKDPSDMNQAGKEVYYENYKVADDIAWAPVVDKHFLPDTPQMLRKQGRFHKVSFLAGFTSHEWSVFLNSTLNRFVGPSNIATGVTPAAFRKFLEVFSQRRTDSKRNAALLSDALRFVYTPWPDTSNSHLLRQALIDAMSDLDFVSTATASLVAHSRVAPAFLFLFSHMSKLDQRPAWMGSQHADASNYIFGISSWYSSEFFSDETDKNVSNFMTTTWTNFAKSGEPTPQPVYGVKWAQFNASSQAYVDINSRPRMGKNYRAQQVAFWNWYYPKLADSGAEGGQPGSGALKFAPQGVRLTMSVLLARLVLLF